MTKSDAASEERSKILRKAKRLHSLGYGLPELIIYIQGRAKRNKATKGGL